MSKFDFSPSGIGGKLDSLRKENASISFLRIIVFVGLVVSFVLSLSEHPIWFVGLFALGWLFVRLINRYNFQKDQEAIYLAIQNQKEELNKQRARELKVFDGGLEYQNKEHPFANDLDLFGEHSLFQLLNHTQSGEARKYLADGMKSDFDLSDAEQKRRAIDELSKNEDFLRAFLSIGKAFYKEGSSKGGMEWLGEQEKSKSWVWPLAILGPVGGVALCTLIYIGVMPASLLGAWILIGLVPLGFVYAPLKKAGDEIPLRDSLKTFRYWLEVLSLETFENKRLNDDNESFQIEGHKAHKVLASLDAYGLWMQNRINLLYIPLNLLFWTDLLLYVRLFNWKNKFGSLVSHFPEALAKWEVWCSLGLFQSEIGANGQVLTEVSGVSGKDIKHPLLDQTEAVGNDFEQNDSVILLTGANMSGKTTFMRTLGINCVLVNLGLRPFADEFGFGSFQLYTSMRNTDNLGESVSSFYAELKRIKTLIDRAESGEPLFFLLDEILKGTNTEDRVAGSEALIAQVLETKALGIISTHDIELSKMGDSNTRVDNFSFHSEVKDQTIDFDYKLKAGPCPSFNAHKLMELMGIRFES